VRVALVYMNASPSVGRGAGWIAGAVLRAGHELMFLDTYHTPVEEAAETIARGGCDTLMISTVTTLFPDALRLVRLAKARADLPVLVGGVHATVAGPALLEEHPEIDFLCLGEGESMVVEFLETLGQESLFATRNLVYRRDGRVIANPPRPPEDLAALPPFPWHLFSTEAIVRGRQRMLTVNASRGCPFNCSYCCNGQYLRMYGKGYLRFRGLPELLRELSFLKREYEPRLFYFGDEMLFFDKELAIELFRTVQRDLRVSCGAMARVESLTPEFCEALAEAGCVYLGVGVECGDEDFRKQYLNRSTSTREIASAFRSVKKAGIFVTSYNMIGYPFDFDDRLTQATIALNREIEPDYAQFTIFYPFPGTTLYQHCVEHDLIDQNKVSTTRDYYAESVLKGVSLRQKRREVQALFPSSHSLERRLLRACRKRPLPEAALAYARRCAGGVKQMASRAARGLLGRSGPAVEPRSRGAEDRREPRKRKPYQPKEYWEKRLSTRPLDVAAVGHGRLGHVYNQWLYRANFRALRRAIAAAGVPVSGAAILDVGVGSGAFIPFWQERGASALVGLDLTATSVERLSRRHPQFRFIECDISTELPPGLAGTFDIATALSVLFHITDDRRFSKAIANLSAAVRPGGWVILSDCLGAVPSERFHHEYYRAHDHYVRELEGAGLAVAHLEPVFFLMAKPVCDCGVPGGRFARGLTKATLRMVHRLSKRRATEWVNHLPGAALYLADGLLGRVAGNGPGLKILLARKG